MLGIGFRKRMSLFLMLITLVSAVMPPDNPAIAAVRSEAVPEYTGQLLSATSNRREAERFTVKKSTVEQMAELLEQNRINNPRTVRQSRLFGIAMNQLFSEKSKLQKHFCSVGCRKQKELISRSRQIVEYMCKADGKKSRLISFIG